MDFIADGGPLNVMETKNRRYWCAFRHGVVATCFQWHPPPGIQYTPEAVPTHPPAGLEHAEPCAHIELDYSSFTFDLDVTDVHVTTRDVSIGTDITKCDAAVTALVLFDEGFVGRF